MNDLQEMGIKKMTDWNPLSCDPNSEYIDNYELKNIVYTNINKNNYCNFFLCLFMIIVIDMGMFKYCRNYYRKKIYNIFRKKTMYPKFGNVGFGFSFRNPKNIITIPEQLNLININDITNNINEIY